MSVVTLSPRNNSIVRLNSSLLGIDRDGEIETMTWRQLNYMLLANIHIVMQNKKNNVGLLRRQKNIKLNVVKH